MRRTLRAISEIEGSPDDGNGDCGERDVPSTAQRIAANDQVGREWISELPEGKAPFPDDPLFDTERDQLENRLRDDPDADPDS